MSSDTQNPLFKHFRQPQLHLKLPSGGRWWATGSLDLPVTGELPVYAMTARDELILKTPDALLNGSATADVIQSCCPAIKDAWQMPTVDLDSILIAIRIATYGNRMEFSSICPHCEERNDHAVDLNALASQIECPDFDTTVSIDGLEIYIRPETYQEFSNNSMKNYEEQRILSLVQNETIPESEKVVKFNEMFKKLVNANIDHVVRSVAGIKSDDGTVVENYAQLNEFFSNCNRPIWDAVKTRLMELGAHNTLRNIPVHCDNEKCRLDYTAPLLFELSSFFG